MRNNQILRQIASDLKLLNEELQEKKLDQYLKSLIKRADDLDKLEGDVNKIFKKGTKVYLCWCTHDLGSTSFEELVLEEDMNEVELMSLANEAFYNDKEPEWWVSDEKPRIKF